MLEKTRIYFRKVIQGKEVPRFDKIIGQEQVFFNFPFLKSVNLSYNKMLGSLDFLLFTLLGWDKPNRCFLK